MKARLVVTSLTEAFDALSVVDSSWLRSLPGHRRERI
jgi:hypothetical protein